MCISSVTLTFVVLLTAGQTKSACYSDESCLYDQLMTDYNSEVRPVSGPSGIVNVSLILDLKNILGLEERNEVLDSVLEIIAIWTDNYLTWNISQYDVPSILISVKKLWLPDIAVTNSAEQFYQRTFLEDFRAEISNEGEVAWRYGGVFKTTCSMDITNYPFDNQTCSIIIENWSYRESLVNITSGTLLTDSFEQNSLWELTSTSTTHESFTSKFLAYPRMTFTFHLKRKTAYYVVNLLLPCSFIMLAALALFWLPPDCGEKVSLGITVLVAFSVFQIVIMESTPVNSDQMPFISDVVLTIMSMSTVSLLSSVLTTYLHFKGSEVRVPKWLRTVAFRYLAKVLFLRSEVRALESTVFPEGDIHYKDQTQNVESERNVEEFEKIGNPKNELEAILQKLSIIADTITLKQKEEYITDEWKLLARVIDRLLFWASVILLIIIISAIIPY